MTETKKSNKKILLGIGIGAVLVGIVAALAIIYFVFAPKPVQGAKAITIEVVDDAQESTVYELNTDAEYLRQAMDEATEQGFTYSGTESEEYGLTIYTINGVTADFNTSNAYWAIYVNGEYGNYSVDKQVVTNQDVFRFVYTIYTE